MNYSDAYCERSTSHPSSKLHRLLIVEPVRLLRWSLSRYLSQWFCVEAVATTQEAEQVLDAGDVDAVLVSDALPRDGAHYVETRASRLNTHVRIVRMVSVPVSFRKQVGPVRHIEKPFELGDMKKLLQEII